MNQTCCGLCGEEFRPYGVNLFRSVEPNTFNSETTHVHVDCAIAAEKRTDAYLDRKTVEVFSTITNWKIKEEAHGKGNRPGASANRGGSGR